MFHLSSILILIQIPIVISIIIIGFHAINIFRAREFYLINFGWIVNLVYLNISFLSNKSMPTAKYILAFSKNR